MSLGGGIPSWAVKGARVVCVDDADFGGYGFEATPQAGGVYTIRQVVWCEVHASWQARLMEVANPALIYPDGPEMWEPAFDLGRFRPVVELKSDNEIEAQIFRNRKQKQPHSAPRKVSA